MVLVSACGGFLYENSAEASGERSVNSVLTSDFTGYGPVDRIIKIKIKPDQIAKIEKQVVTVKTTVTMPFDYPENLEYKWLLSENVQIKGGNATGTLNNFKANVPQEVEIQVVGFSEIENRQIVFQISGTKNGRRLFADGIITTQKENTFEDIVQNVEKIKAEAKEEN